MTIEELYQSKLAGKDQWLDMVPRMPDLRRYAENVETIVEFGCRSCNSTTAFLAGGARVTSYDIEDPKFTCPKDAERRWTFLKEDTRLLSSIPPTDLLFLDTIHTAEQVFFELQMESFVKRYIMFHDVKEWGWRGEANQPGILHTIFRFLASHREWAVSELCANDPWGLLVLERINAQ